MLQGIRGDDHVKGRGRKDTVKSQEVGNDDWGVLTGHDRTGRLQVDPHGSVSLAGKMPQQFAPPTADIQNTRRPVTWAVLAKCIGDQLG